MTPSPPTSPPPAVRRLTLADLDACVALAADCGWPPEHHKWRLLLAAGRGYGIDAAAGDGPAGGLIAAVVVTPYGREAASVGMMLVASRHQRRGLGERLLRTALERCATEAVFLTATDRGRPLYERLGFKPVGAVTTLRGAFAPAGGQAAGGVAVRAATAADLPGVLAYDLPAFGADRTPLLTRLPAFSDRFLVAERPGGGLAGYAARWPNAETAVAGPVLADDEAVARALITALAAGSDAPLRFDADDRHPRLAAWLRASGLAETARCTLMVLGAPGLPGDPARRFAPYSLALG
ncbi:GNAT family N-acetyltransferase [Streptomyces sp. DSM 44917]|uniref:GNAT family N-acetyltransferase n=1 Tax=Streptomyces boetiae TaxID=3075541 RepID=A0ABU2L687_9ACTN|nr:GNAT family N-acetyltransferase [Streptomyces sp. DSM 44917]MDT0307071.1 GNAT family N-acetyltransferase [Streptomyces sp. DSM 44917]